jgi:nicotinate-nucleotide--dimethylbenzimidazole phosphoribosyltransferase
VSEQPEQPEEATLRDLREALDRAAEGIGRRDTDAENAARTAVGSGTTAAGRLGLLAEWGIWLSGIQGAYPPRPLDRVTMVVVGPPPTADHPVHRLVTSSGVTSNAVDLQGVSTSAEAANAGAAAVDHAVDAGCDLLVLPAVLDEELSGTLVALLLRLSATEVVGDAAYVDDAQWATRVAGIRDRTHPARALEDDPVALVDAIGSPVLVALVGMLLRAAARRTPVLLDGPADCAAALAASRHAILGSWWWFAASTSSDQATTRAVEALGLEPLLHLDCHLDGGAAALAALPVLRSTQAVLAAESPATGSDPVTR